MYYRIILVGPGSSGKNYACKFLCDIFGMHFGCTYTTRPIRNGEVNGKDYFFINKEQFIKKLNNDEFYTWMTFNNGEWYYGIDKNDFYNPENNVIIMTPGDIKQLLRSDRKKSLIVYFNISEDVRKERLSKRNDADNVERRLQVDREDFKTFTDYDIEINKEDFTIEDLKEIYLTYRDTS